MINIVIKRTNRDNIDKMNDEFWSEYADLGKYFNKHVSNDEYEMDMIRRLYIIAYNQGIKDVIDALPIEASDSIMDEIVSECIRLIKER